MNVKKKVNEKPLKTTSNDLYMILDRTGMVNSSDYCEMTTVSKVVEDYINSVTEIADDWGVLLEGDFNNLPDIAIIKIDWENKKVALLDESDFDKVITLKKTIVKEE